MLAQLLHLDGGWSTERVQPLLSWSTIVTLVGYVAIIRMAVGFALWLRLTFFTTNNLNRYRIPSADTWALVTGSTDGIGKGFAKELLRRGLNVVLLSRNEKKLKETQTELLAAAGSSAQCKYIVADAEQATDDRLYDRIKTDLRAIMGNGGLTILVNNVGISLDMAYVHEQQPNLIDKLVLVNCLFPTKLTVHLIPLLLANSRGGKARQATAIVNVSSFSSLVASPFLTIYSATKAFNARFSDGLASELGEFGVDLLCVTPSFVASAMTGTNKVNLERCSAEACACGSLDKLGAGRLVSPYWFHALQQLVATAILPESVRNNVIFNLLKKK